MRKFFLFYLLLTISSLAQAEVVFKISYSPAADEFHLMDQTSNWLDGYCDIEYRKYWESHFGVSEQDKVLFARYRSVHRKYFYDPDQAEKDPLKNRNGFFSTEGERAADRLGAVFYSSKTLDEALEKASKLLEPEDLVFLKQFYRHFQDKIDLLLAESRAFEKVLPVISKKISRAEISSFYEKILHFYKVKGEVSFLVLYFWWPPLQRTAQTPSGNVILAMYNPVTQLKSAEEDVDILSHEVVHVISARQPFEQKQILTKMFLEKCEAGKKLRRLQILEEPLAVAIGQLLFKKNTLQKDFGYSSNLYNDPWINTFSRLVFPVLEEELYSNRDITKGFIEKSGKVCRDLFETIVELNRNK